MQHEEVSGSQIDLPAFLDWVVLLASNTCILARSLYIAYSKGPHQLSSEVMKYFPAKGDFETLSNAIIDEQLRFPLAKYGFEAIVQHTRGSHNLISFFLKQHPELIPLLDGSKHVMTSIDPSLRPYRTELRRYASAIRYQVITMQGLLNNIEERAIELRGIKSPVDVVRVDAIPIKSGIPENIPDLPGKKPFPMPNLQDLQEELWQLYSLPNYTYSIDSADAVPDHHQAINLLNNVLRRGVTGFEAGRVYFLIGKRYESLTDYIHATEFFTRALDEPGYSEAVVFPLLGRSRAKLRLGQLAEARADVEAALKLGLQGDELQEARILMAQL